MAELTKEDPLASYRFKVEISGKDSFQAYFTECKLPDVEWDIQEIKEGGLNDYTHQLPGRRKAAKISLKNGLASKGELFDWYAQIMNEKFKDMYKTVTITLVNAMGEDVMKWNVDRAFPTRLAWPELKSADNVVAVQTLELACGKLTVEPQ